MNDLEKRPCDANDIVCQLEVLRSLKSLKHALGDGAFALKFPELVDVEDRLISEIQCQETVVQESLESCVEEEEPAEVAGPEEEPSAEPVPD